MVLIIEKKRIWSKNKDTFVVLWWARNTYVDCIWVVSMQCLLIKEEWSDERNYFYDEIEWFDYQEGHEYTLRVKETHLDPIDIPADVSSIKWKLKEIEEKKKTKK